MGDYEGDDDFGGGEGGEEEIEEVAEVCILTT
jgi:hypothetical protein